MTNGGSSERQMSKGQAASGGGREAPQRFPQHRQRRRGHTAKVPATLLEKPGYSRHFEPSASEVELNCMSGWIQWLNPVYL
ncbi:hypothetical protein NDU88_004910 [Pleurodeles waltl]|uniref:Uncharacterized protein n=1 Tax=Pleurodeles waltl TaxID=8319 RepID=A0AAV7WWT8_PLEWA|nr:hypothetical protein NDU88_004910 [Pleurodeles waltl]